MCFVRFTGAQYEAPFKKDQDDYEDINCLEVVFTSGHSILVHNLIYPVGASSSCLLEAIPLVNNMPSPTPKSDGATDEVAFVSYEDEIGSMLADFISTLFPNENVLYEVCNYPSSYLF